MSAEEFWNRKPRAGDREAELVDGRVVEMPPAGRKHGRIDSRLHREISGFVEQQGLEEVFLNTGFILRRNPDVVRGPDQASIAVKRLAANPEPEVGYSELRRTWWWRSCLLTIQRRRSIGRWATTCVRGCEPSGLSTWGGEKCTWCGRTERHGSSGRPTNWTAGKCCLVSGCR
jgi:hypothetical protein